MFGECMAEWDEDGVRVRRGGRKVEGEEAEEAKGGKNRGQNWTMDRITPSEASCCSTIYHHPVIQSSSSMHLHKKG